MNAYNIVNVLFNRGNFDEKGVAMISSALIAYSIGLFLVGLKDVFIKASYVAGNQKIPLKITILSILLNVVFNIILGYFYGHVGIALSTSLSIVISSILAVYLFQKHIMKIYTLKQVRFILQVSLVGISTFIICYAMDSWLFANLNIYFNLIINFTMIVMTYSVFVYILKLHKGSVK